MTHLLDAIKAIANERASTAAQWDGLAVKLLLLASAESQAERETLAAEAMDYETDIHGGCSISAEYAGALGLDTDGIARRDDATVDAPSVASQLRRAREAQGLTQAQLAQAAGLTRQQVAKLESADNNPTIESVGAVAQALGLRLELVA